MIYGNNKITKNQYGVMPCDPGSKLTWDCYGCEY